MSEEEREGFLVEPYAAAEAEKGWELLFNGQVYTMLGRRRGAPRRPGEDHHLAIQVDRDPWVFTGEEFQMVYKIVGQVDE